MKMKRILALGAAILFLAASCIFLAGCAAKEANGSGASPSAIIIDDGECTCLILLPQEMTEYRKYDSPEAIGRCLAEGIEKWKTNNPHKKLVEMGLINYPCYIYDARGLATAPTGGVLIYYYEVTPDQ